MLLCYSHFNPLHILPSQVIRESGTRAHVTTLTVSHQPHTPKCPGYSGQRRVPEGICAQEKALSGPKKPLSFAPGPGGDCQHWVLQQDKLTPQSWVLSGLGELLPPHRQSKALGSRVVGKPAGPSSATPHEPAQDVLAFLDCC